MACLDQISKPSSSGFCSGDSLFLLGPVTDNTRVMSRGQLGFLDFVNVTLKTCRYPLNLMMVESHHSKEHVKPSHQAVGV